MSKLLPPPKHCCCCQDHSHGPLPKGSRGQPSLRVAISSSVKQTFPNGYNALVQAAAKYLASGLVMDYTKLNNDFEEASKATCENILDILHDISSYDFFILERDATFDGRSGCSEGCNECSECSGRRRARPDTRDLAHLQMSLRQLFDLIYQNFFHRILCPRKDHVEEGQMTLITALHRVFTPHSVPIHKDWKQELAYFERAGSESVKLPLKQSDRLPKGCPASLCFSRSQDSIDEFIDRVLCSTQVLHEKYNSTHHHTTEVTLSEDICPICNRSAAWLLPALVAPWFIERNMRKRQTLATLKQSTDIPIPTSVLNALKNAPTNFPTFPPPPDPLPAPPAKSAARRKPRKAPAVLMPNPPLYLGFLLPYCRKPFQPVKNPDPVKHPYSYFLSLDDEMRKAWIQHRAKKTRDELGLEQPAEQNSSGPWRCGWFCATECGLHAEDWITDGDTYSTPKKLASFRPLGGTNETNETNETKEAKETGEAKETKGTTENKPWEELDIMEAEIFGNAGLEALGKCIADKALERIQVPGGSTILQDMGKFMERVVVHPPAQGVVKGKKK